MLTIRTVSSMFSERSIRVAWIHHRFAEWNADVIKAASTMIFEPEVREHYMYINVINIFMDRAVKQLQKNR